MTKHRLHYLTFSSILIFLIALSGCGGGSSAVDNAGKQANDFARNSVAADEEITEGGTASVTSCSSTKTSLVTYCLAVEATDAMIASWQSDVYNLLTPGKAYAFRGLSTVQAKSVEVIQVNENLEAITSSIIPAYTVQENSALGTYSISFDEAPPGRLDIVAKVTLNNGEILFAPFIALNVEINDSPEVIVNVVSDFQIKQLYNQLSTTEDLARLLPCTDLADNIGCENQPAAKQNNWNGLTHLVQNYEINIPPSLTITQAFELLNNTAEFKNHIQTSINEITRIQEPFVGGTERNLDSLDLETEDDFQNLITNKNYNSSLFALAFNQIAPDSAAPDASISTSISTTFDEIISGIDGAADVTIFTYPELTEFIQNFNISVTSLAGDFPFERRSLIQTTDNKISLTPAQNNAFTSAPGNSFLTTQGFYLSGKVPYQTISDKTETSGTGWQFDPYMHLLYSAASDGGKPNSLLSSFVSNGSSFFITTDGSSTWDRKTKLEEQNLFSWTVHNEIDAEGDFTTDIISGKTYGVVSYSVKLNDTGTVLKTTGKTSLWEAQSVIEIMAENQPTLLVPAGGEQHYQTYSFDRDDQQLLSVPTATNDPAVANRTYTAIKTTKSTSNGLVSADVGRLEMSALGNVAEKSTASSTPDGSMLTVTLNEDAAGQGIIQAMEMRTTQPDFSATPVTYRLSGNSLGANAASNILRNYSESKITITGSSVALTLNTIESTHNISTQNITGLTELTEITANGTIATVDGAVRMVFPDVAGKILILKGFISKSLDDSNIETTQPGNLMTLLMTHGYDTSGVNIGLVHAFREQSLPVWEEVTP